MERLKAKFTMYLHWHFKRYRLRKICEALDIVPYPWQRDFALDKIDIIPAPMSYRRSGKTMAVMLRLLMVRPGELHNILGTLRKDPDFTNKQLRRLSIYSDEYMHLASKCVDAGIPVNYLQLERFHNVL